MNADPSTANTDHNLPIFSVSEISGALKRAVEGAFARVRVRGEVSGFKRAASGHLYFSLKDEDAVLDGVCWRGAAARLGLEPEDGMEVVATGRLTTYAGRSKYQIVVEQVEIAGEGALLKLLEERRRRLADEGLFDEDRKRGLPFLPDVVGVVTSETGAVIRDILHRLDDRFPRPVLLWPVIVQGPEAPGLVAAAIAGFDAMPADGPIARPDVLIVARGGGSLEDLMAFNEEVVVRAAAACSIPLISAVGHETDTTLLDFAADMRAPTPSAAAEMAVPVRTELIGLVADGGARMTAAVNRLIGDGRIEIRGLVRGLPDLKGAIEAATQRLDDWTERLGNALGVGLGERRRDLGAAAAGLRKPQARIDHAARLLAGEMRSLKRAGRAIVKDRGERLGQAAALLDSFSYERVLERGFALIADGDGRTVGSAAQLGPGDVIDVRFHDGRAGATVDSVTPAGGGGKRSKPVKRHAKRPKADGRQGKLL